MRIELKTPLRQPWRLRSRGFTLIEVMTVVAMITVMGTIAVSRFGVLVQYEWRVRDAATSLRSTMVLAAAEARSHGRLTSVFLGSGDCTPGGTSPTTYSYLRSNTCTSVDLPKDIVFGLPDAISTGPDAGTGAHEVDLDDGVTLPGNTVTFNTQGFLVFPLTIAQDSVYLHYRQEGSEGDPHYARAMTVSLIGRPSVYKWNIEGDEWIRVDRR